MEALLWLPSLFLCWDRLTMQRNTSRLQLVTNTWSRTAVALKPAGTSLLSWHTLKLQIPNTVRIHQYNRKIMTPLYDISWILYQAAWPGCTQGLPDSVGINSINKAVGQFSAYVHMVIHVLEKLHKSHSSKSLLWPTALVMSWYTSEGFCMSHLKKQYKEQGAGGDWSLAAWNVGWSMICVRVLPAR